MKNPRQPDRIVHCADYGGPYSGSFVPMLVAAAKAARERGYETAICFSEVARDRAWLSELEDLAEVSFIERSGVRGNLRQLHSIVGHAAGSTTILHTHFGTFDEAAALLRLRRRRTRVLWHAHSGTTRRIRLRSKAYGTVFGSIINGIICVSAAMQEEMLARRFPAGKVWQLPNAIDIDRFPAISSNEREAARRALAVPSTAKVVLHFAWNWAIKGGEALLATARAIGSNPDVMFLTVIGENGGDAPRDEIDRTPNVRALAPSSNVNELYAAADAFLNCSQAEGGLPYAVLEALARGLPAVVTVPPVRPELVAGLPGGRAVARAPAEIVAALEEVLAFTPAQRSDHAEAARARVARAYALDAWAHRLVDLYDETLRPGQRR